ncbi:MAG: bifunctional riboflavin kinase/FAD synthetase [Anaerolineae bacterium]|nr:bifunctional riboflavin kinase/FAD synthetase [Anaerolineae bacterium]
MWIERGLEQLSPTAPTQLVIGAFDGLHRGHQALIGGVVAAARAIAGQAVVLTFDPLPRQYFNGKPARTWLSSLEERLEQLAVLELDGVIVQPFDAALSALPARAFLSRLQEHVHLVGLWAGPDFALGQGRGGTLEVLRQLGIELGFTVHTFAPFIWRGTAVHSSDIRRLLQEGHIEAANDLLGRAYRLTGRVCPGEQRGRRLGFPTANLEVPSERLLPKDGIYICRAHLARGSFEAVINVGTRPTFNHSDTTVEAHLLDFDADIYGESLRLDFLTRLRSELRFASAEALVQQMHKDVAQARRWLAAQV